MNRLPFQKRVQILSLLCEGNSMRAVSRLVDVSINTVTKLLIDAGEACSDYQNRALRRLSCKRLQLDEIWDFVYAKQRNVPESMKGRADVGDIWTWTAIDADTKLIVSWMVGDRGYETARLFVDDLSRRLKNRVQITTDGHRAYLDAVDYAFAKDVDYAMLEKIYAAPIDSQSRYSPPQCIGAKRRAIIGNPDKKHISTSFAERQNLTMRMNIRRFTRLTNAFSKKAENHAHAVSLHFMFYNFCRVHKTLRITPAMAAGVTEHVWEVAEIVDMIEREELEQLSTEGTKRIMNL
jgi:IS1 family transposase